jgi:hypothetical protein
MAREILLKKSDDDNDAYLNFMTEVEKSFSKNFNFYFDKMIFAIKLSIKNNDKKIIKNFELYMKKERDNHLNFVNKVKLYLFAIVNNIFNSNTEFISKYLGKTNALVAMPKLSYTAFDYKDLINKNKHILLELKK